jgi:hypothetical protein|tara:strand:+ start:5995 stop:6255 length:261 start_codon:yes stop_codon:yes gene_type:complete
MEDRDLNVPKFPVVRLDEGNWQNDDYPLTGFDRAGAYMVIGEVAYGEDNKTGFQGIDHYILMNFNGKVMPGMYHADRFRFATDEEF